MNPQHRAAAAAVLCTLSAAAVAVGQTNQPTERIEGIVLDASGHRVEGARVHVIELASIDAFADAPGASHRHVVTTDSEGSFALRVRQHRERIVWSERARDAHTSWFSPIYPDAFGRRIVLRERAALTGHLRFRIADRAAWKRAEPLRFEALARVGRRTLPRVTFRRRGDVYEVRDLPSESTVQLIFRTWSGSEIGGPTLMRHTSPDASNAIEFGQPREFRLHGDPGKPLQAWQRIGYAYRSLGVGDDSGQLSVQRYLWRIVDEPRWNRGPALATSTPDGVLDDVYSTSAGRDAIPVSHTRGHETRVRVLSATGKPVSTTLFVYRTAYVGSWTTTGWRIVRTQADDATTIDGIHPRQYLHAVMFDRTSAIQSPFVIFNRPSHSRLGVSTHDLDVRRLRDVVLTFVNADRDAIPHGEVWIGGSPVQRFVCDRDGRLHVRLEPGDHNVQLRLKGRWVGIRDHVRVPTEAGRVTKTMRCESVVSVRGVVLGPDGGPPYLARIRTAPSALWPRHATTDPDGSFVLHVRKTEDRPIRIVAETLGAKKPLSARSRLSMDRRECELRLAGR